LRREKDGYMKTKAKYDCTIPMNDFDFYWIKCQTKFYTIQRSDVTIQEIDLIVRFRSKYEHIL
jgi:hypothetical protein